MQNLKVYDFNMKWGLLCIDWGDLLLKMGWCEHYGVLNTLM